jgi:signal transduction histidine kinase/ligand-binding sensor domain-containing protein
VSILGAWLAVAMALGRNGVWAAPKGTQAPLEAPKQQPQAPTAAPRPSLPVIRVQSKRPPALVRAAVATPDGYLWVATERGLKRFDGLTFSEVNIPLLPRAAVTEGATNGSGAAASGEGFAARDGGAGSRGITAETDVRGLAVCPDGALWIGTDTGEVFRLERGVLERAPERDRPPGAVQALACDAGGSAWGGFRNRVARLEGERWTELTDAAGAPLGRLVHFWHAPAGPATGARFLIEAGRGWWSPGRERAEQIAPSLGWEATERLARGLLLLGEASKAPPMTEAGARGALVERLPRALRDGMIQAVLLDHRGRRWVGTDGGLILASPEGTVTVTAHDGLPDSHVRHLAEDPEGGIWVVTHGGGLAVATTPAVTAIGLREGLGGNTPFAVSRGPDGTVWATTVGGLTSIRGSEIANAKRPSRELPQGVLRSVLAAADGTVWATTISSTLLRYVPADGHAKALRLPGLAEDDDVTLLHEEPSKGLLVGTSTGALLRWREERFQTLIPPVAGCRPAAVDRVRCKQAVNVAAPRREGGLWLGTFGDGLWIWQDDLARRVPAATSGTLPTVTALLEDDAETLWIGTDRGLYLRRGDDLRLVELHEHDHRQPVYEIVDDLRGSLWIAGGRSILQTTRRDLVGMANRDASVRPPIRYTTADGLTSDMTMGAFDRPAVRGGDGRLWFVNVAGLTMIEPRLLEEPPAPIAAIDEIQIGATRLTWPAAQAWQDPARPLRVPALDRDLGLAFSAPVLGAPHRLTFQYRLDGVDRGWVQSGARRSIRYAHLAPGPYTFRVSALRDDVATPGPEVRLHLWFLPRFHETRLFLGLVAGTLAMLVGMALWWRSRQVTARFLAVMAERERIGHDLHDTLAQVFSALGFQVDSLAKAAQHVPPELDQRMRRLRQMIAHGRRAARAVVANLRARPGSEPPLERAIEGIADLYAGIKLSVTVDGQPYPLGPSRQNELLRIAEQAVSNAVEHGAAHHIGVELAYAPERFVMWIRDDGQGFSPAAMAPSPGPPAGPPGAAARAGEAPTGAGTPGVDLDHPPAAAAGTLHFGLRGMNERAARAGGRFEIESYPGVGTEVTVVIEQPRRAQPR